MCKFSRKSDHLGPSYDSNMFKIETNNVKPSKGKILISEPFLSDDIFSRSVVLLVQHNDEEGSMGFVLNKFVPENYYPSEMKRDYPFKINIAYGGPVEMDKLFYIHNLSPEELPYSLEIMPGLFWGGDYEILRKKLINGEILPDQVRFFIGYSGWAPYQLQSELQRNSWIVGEITPKQVLTPDVDLWKHVLNQFDLKYKLWAIYPQIPELS